MKRGLGLDAGQNNHLHFFKVHAGDELAERFAQVGFEVFRVRSDRLVLAQKLVDIQDGILYWGLKVHMIQRLLLLQKHTQIVSVQLFYWNKL